MTTDTINDADVLAELREDELWMGAGEAITGLCTRLQRRLALARREAREAAAVERKACLHEVTKYYESLRDGTARMALSTIAARIRARGQS